MIRNEDISDAVLDYDVHMRESIRFDESSRSNHLVNNDILLNSEIYELYRVEHLKDSAIMHQDEMNSVAYPDDLRLLSYDDVDIKLILNSMSSVRQIDQYKHQRAEQALEMNMKLDALIRAVYLSNQ